jgi:hypothetical protein
MLHLAILVVFAPTSAPALWPPPAAFLENLADLKERGKVGNLQGFLATPVVRARLLYRHSRIME